MRDITNKTIELYWDLIGRADSLVN